MVPLRFRYSTATRLQTPFPVSSIPMDGEIPLLEALCTVAPEKTAYWQAQAPDQLLVDVVPHLPFGPSLGQLMDTLGFEPEAAITAIQQRFGVAIEVAGLPPDRRPPIKGVTYRCCLAADARGPRIDAVELGALGKAASVGEFSPAVIVSCFLDPERIYSFVAPRGLELGKILLSDADIAARLEDCTAPGLRHPISGQTWSLDDTASTYTNAICIADCGYVLLPEPSFLFGFPFFNRSLSMRKATVDESEPRPCSNCLACKRHCPADLRPSFLHHSIGAGDEEAVESLAPRHCIQCGRCSYVCPSGLPLFESISEAITRLDGEGDDE
ncbi:MAG: 4Fe-4S dicluster domain-containing protein [Lentisphaerae bacterium]|nr:4Fe-4S dicluster domain-containing protein [Lentisphaerota bacterium]MBT4816371.1 4Fe-4S dicluster domain-containing protein [Lentisphaerota bacterium]MBT5605571.1 4Fe-4S dicluster domain-containing protein [Lentisphaerota bacterium]MBT7056848.1 4Fe-4S dicluster domain-containing protein [Lentisphaerota bacterium]MBT7845366.1 4Fe-4S dicluster domain-containing protein [Lentisphaerota bacterium]